VWENRLELDIIRLFNRDVALQLSINQISKKLGKSYPHINSKVNELIDQGILNKTQVGRSHLCSVNLLNDKAVLLLSMNESLKKDKKIKKIKNSGKFIEEIREIGKEFDVHTIILLDTNLIFVLDHIYDKEAIKNTFSAIKKFDLDFFTKEEFQQHLLQPKEIQDSKVIMYSFENYFEIVQEIHKQLIIENSGIIK